MTAIASAMSADYLPEYEAHDFFDHVYLRTIEVPVVLRATLRLHEWVPRSRPVDFETMPSAEQMARLACSMVFEIDGDPCHKKVPAVVGGYEATLALELKQGTIRPAPKTGDDMPRGVEGHIAPMVKYEQG